MILISVINPVVQRFNFPRSDSFDQKNNNQNSSSHTMSSIWMIVVVFAAFLTSGCDIPDRPPLSPLPVEKDSLTSNAIDDGATNGTSEPPRQQIEADWETWDAYFVGDRHVGYNHILCEAKETQGAEKAVVYQLDNVLFVNQGQARTLQRLRESSTETIDGSLIDFESTLQVGPVVTKFSGLLSGLGGEGNLLQVETLRGSKRTVKTVSWDPSNRGLVAIEQSLRSTPLLEKGETRTIKMLLSGYYVVATARLKCSGEAFVPMLDGEMKNLIEINYEVELENGGTNYSTIWTDQDGKVRRTYSPGIDLVAYRTDRATATALPQSTKENLWLPIDGKVENADQAKRIAYVIAPLPGLEERASSEQKSHLVSIEPAPMQIVRRTDANRFQVVVSRDAQASGESGPSSAGFVHTELVPNKFDTSASYYVDYNDRTVRGFADAAVASRKLSKREIAIEMTRTVQTLIELDAERAGLEKASEIASEGVASDLGRAIFLTAMLRAKKIPARVALGVRYQSGTPARMVFHPWTLAYIDDQWLALDVESGGVPPPDRLTLSTAAFGGANEYQAFVPLLESISRIEIKVLKSQ